MTVQAVRRARRRAARTERPDPPASLAIGEIGQTVFDCPSCTRPLALGTRRCPGCGARLIGRVTLGAAARFVVVGLAIGLVSGGAVGFTAGSGRTPGPAGAVLVAAGNPSGAPAASGKGAPASPTSAPRASATASPSTRPTTPPGAISPSARAALGQVAGTNSRLSLAAGSLRAVLASTPFDASEAARVLRGISADSLYGEQLGARIGAWWGTATTGQALTAYYTAVHATAAEGLVFSVRNEAAYQATTSAMLGHLDALSEIDEAVAAAARSAGVDLPTPPPAG